MKENDYSFKEIGMIERVLLTVQNKNLNERSNIMNESNKYIIENMSIGCIIVDENDIELV